MEVDTIIAVSVLGGVCLVLLVFSLVLFAQVYGLRRQIRELNENGRTRIQKLTPGSDKNHAFNNPTLTPGEELSKRGYSMYQGSDEDVESGRGTELHTNGVFVDELVKEMDNRHQRQSHTQNQNPPFLLQSIESSKKIRALANPVAKQSSSDANPNFMY